jgi:hypothetical protein
MRHETEHKRIVEAYIKMAEVAHYRPAAPGDGMGSVDLTEDELENPERLSEEAASYADDFIKQEDSHFRIGVSDASTNRALVYAIEAARALCSPDPDLALSLFKMAVEETKESKRERSAAGL